MQLHILDEIFSICKVSNYSKIDITQNFVFTSKTDEEYSLVCPTYLVPCNTIQREDGWHGFRIEGILDFSLIGILSKISSILANHNIGIFVISTFNTDYIFVKEESFPLALETLKKEGYQW